MRVRQTAAIVSICWRRWQYFNPLTEEYQSNVEMKDKCRGSRNWVCDAESPSSTCKVVLEIVVHKPECEDHCMYKSEDDEEESPGPLIDHPSLVLFPDCQVARCLSADLPRHQHSCQRRQARSRLRCAVGGRAPRERSLFFHGLYAGVLSPNRLPGYPIQVANFAQDESSEPAG
jgi:hypothetical protein